MNVCVCERERVREKERGGESLYSEGEQDGEGERLTVRGRDGERTRLSVVRLRRESRVKEQEKGGGGEIGGKIERNRDNEEKEGE